MSARLLFPETKAQPWRLELRFGDCRKVLRKLALVDAVVTDPPYELGFMGRAWDGTGIAYSVGLWREVLRVLKPGGHLLAFGGTRTYHRMTCAIEDAGFEIRDSLHWMYGTGFPKSLDVSKAMDKDAGAEREVVGQRDRYRDGKARAESDRYRNDGGIGLANGGAAITAPATDLARQWDGWGTAVKPAHEPIVLARKPLEGTVAQNVTAHGTGAQNIDGCRIHSGPSQGGRRRGASALGLMNDDGWTPKDASIDRSMTAGRWPANVLLDEDTARELDAQVNGAGMRCSRGDSGGTSTGKLGRHGRFHSAKGFDSPKAVGYGDESPGASRFFYVAKPSRAERDLGCEALPAKTGGEATDREDDSAGTQSPRAGAGRTGGARNFHPTVKPLALMRYLVRLVTPPGGTVLDPFMGSGTTGIAAQEEGFGFVGIESEAQYLEIARRRIDAWRHRHKAA